MRWVLQIYFTKLVKAQRSKDINEYYFQMFINNEADLKETYKTRIEAEKAASMFKTDKEVEEILLLDNVTGKIYKL